MTLMMSLIINGTMISSPRGNIKDHHYNQTNYHSSSSSYSSILAAISTPNRNVALFTEKTTAKTLNTSTPAQMILQKMNVQLIQAASQVFHQDHPDAEDMLRRFDHRKTTFSSREGSYYATGVIFMVSIIGLLLYVNLYHENCFTEMFFKASNYRFCYCLKPFVVIRSQRPQQQQQQQHQQQTESTQFVNERGKEGEEGEEEEEGQTWSGARVVTRDLTSGFLELKTKDDYSGSGAGSDYDDHDDPLTRDETGRQQQQQQQQRHKPPSLHYFQLYDDNDDDVKRSSFLMETGSEKHHQEEASSKSSQNVSLQDQEHYQLHLVTANITPTSPTTPTTSTYNYNY